MKVHDNVQLILGPPGTGKTTKLLSIMEKELANNISPSQIAFVSFTRKAAYEAKERAMKKFKYEQSDLPWFRTLHSFAYGCLGLSRTDVFNIGHAIDFGKRIGEFIVLKQSDESDILDLVSSTMSNGSLMLFIENLSRMKMKPLKEVWKEVCDDKISWQKMEWFSRSYKYYKDKIGLYDFTDMIYKWIEEGFRPKLKVAIIDEAQDLCRLQWGMISRLVENCERVYIAGDDDQSIYEWSGADIKSFLNLQYKDQIILNHSFRLPEKIWKLANSISSKIKDRKEKNWNHREEDGLVKFSQSLNDVPIESGEWLFLVRNKIYVEELTELCKTLGYSFESSTYSPLNNNSLQIIKWWERLRKGKYITIEQAKSVYGWMKAGEGYKKHYRNLPGSFDGEKVNLKILKEKYGLLTDEIWHKALTKISVEERELYISLLRKKEPIDYPRIKINTIHSVKGGECDNVALFLDMTRRTFQGLEENPDSEHRVYYVGSTRAKNNLYILEPTSEFYYPMF